MASYESKRKRRFINKQGQNRSKNAKRRQFQEKLRKQAEHDVEGWTGFDAYDNMVSLLDEVAAVKDADAPRNPPTLMSKGTNLILVALMVSLPFGIDAFMKHQVALATAPWYFTSILDGKRIESSWDTEAKCKNGITTFRALGAHIIHGCRQ